MVTLHRKNNLFLLWKLCRHCPCIIIFLLLLLSIRLRIVWLYSLWGSQDLIAFVLNCFISLNVVLYFINLKKTSFLLIFVLNTAKFLNLVSWCFNSSENIFFSFKHPFCFDYWLILNIYILILAESLCFWYDYVSSHLLNHIFFCSPHLANSFSNW